LSGQPSAGGVPEPARRRTGALAITYKNAVLIYNPRAGRIARSGGALIEGAVEALRKNGHEVTAVPTTGPRTAGDIARRHIESGAGLIVAAGGDGVINETAEGMIGSPVPLAILPGGTANVLATELKLGRNMALAAGRLGDWKPRRISVGRIACDGGRVCRHFLLMAGAGLDAHIVYHVNGALKSRTGKFAYWVAGWSLVGRRLPQIRVEAEGATYQCSFALISKVRNYGGDFEIAREVTLLDNQFEAILFEGRSSTPYIKYLAAVALRRLKGAKGVNVIRTANLTLTGPADDRVYLQIDGEFAGRLPAEVRIVEDALTLLLPR
jgi:diacylglycerol kinase (ATP)